ncbi:hypothetical protein [Halalkalibacter krulwichiae]|uniref:Uncharacterized protein n=1 Tax=Halalkalibacter krulwichiae TaxID=199441 RepID=A0A1X9M877_9BACI|nr:hypothetical protein [Halalkalibacter krulwichiae]ARK29628.1 hypothetical protein BkAM31D_06995 [Halalkalibacter krulwichiae]
MKKEKQFNQQRQVEQGNQIPSIKQEKEKMKNVEKDGFRYDYDDSSNV